jgi:hypothetical protein
MVDKKPTKVKEVKKPKESKSELFIRLATKRVSSVLKSLRILGNCSNRSNYEYSQEQINVMSTTIQDSLESMLAKFTPSKKEQETFKF